MPIGAEWQDENGKTLARFEGPWIGERVLSTFPASGACLRFIDPYGDITFNQAQIKVLAAELDALIAAGSERAPKATLVALRQFIEPARGKMHTYVKFIGD